MDHETALVRYAEIKRQLTVLEAELGEIQAIVYAAVEESDGQFETEAFVLKTQRRPKYEFSQEYETKSSDLKALRKKEIDDGVATIDGYVEFLTLKFKDD